MVSQEAYPRIHEAQDYRGESAKTIVRRPQKKRSRQAALFLFQ
jgi:hypothetical protein